MVSPHRITYNRKKWVMNIERVLYVGPLDNGGTCLQRMNSMVSLGYEVTGIDTRPSLFKMLLFKIFRRLYAPLDFSKTNERILKRVKEFQPDIIWIDKGLTVGSKMIARVKEVSPKTLVVSYSPDDMINPDNQSRQYLGALPLYDLHITTKSYNVNELKALGAKKVFFIGNGFCPDIHRPVDVTDEEKKYFGGQVGFVGTYEEARAESIAFLANNGIQIKIWGHGWGGKIGMANIEVMDREVLAEEYAKTICSFDINLNFLRKVNRDLQTTRSIEIPACGGFMLAERTAEHLSLFKEGIESEYFDSNTELLNKVRYYLTHVEERKRIAKAGYERCIHGGYSNQDRLKTIFNYICTDSKYREGA